jgi:uncharacterized membrane protein (DUF2068 family)
MEETAAPDMPPVSATRKRSWPRILVAVALGISGVSAILYAGLLPLPPFSDIPVPIVWMAFGAVELVAAVGVFLAKAWGRWLGVAVVIVTIGLDIARLIATIGRLDPLVGLGTFAIGLVIDVAILWWLLRRWPVEAVRT